MNTSVLPFLSARESVATVSGVHGNPLYTVSYLPEKAPVGTVVLVHGFTENAYKYAELIFSLLHLGFAVLAYDQRGHGRSWRKPGLPDPSVTHVDRFDDYVEDLRILCSFYADKLPTPWYLFAHSMGGAVSALYLEQHPETFSAACLCAPMIAPHRGGVPLAAAKAICFSSISMKMDLKYPFFMKPYAGSEDFDSSCAADLNRFRWYDQVKAAHREFQNSIPSFRWILESLNVTARILRSGAPERIACPVLLSTADRDSSVLPDAQEKFISRVPKGKHIFVKNSRHEIFRSQNDVLFPWWHQQLAFWKEASHA